MRKSHSAKGPGRRSADPGPHRGSHGIALCAACIAGLFALPTRAELLRVGTSGDYPPFSHAISETEYAGFDIEIARRRIARGVWVRRPSPHSSRCRFSPLSWSASGPAAQP